MRFPKKIKRELGLLLMRERHKKCLHSHYVCRQLNLPDATFGWVELGSKGAKWRHFAELLDFYNKDLKIELIERQPEEKNNEA